MIYVRGIFQWDFLPKYFLRRLRTLEATLRRWIFEANRIPELADNVKKQTGEDGEFGRISMLKLL